MPTGEVLIAFGAKTDEASFKAAEERLKKFTAESQDQATRGAKAIEQVIRAQQAAQDKKRAEKALGPTAESRAVEAAKRAEQAAADKKQANTQEAAAMGVIAGAAVALGAALSSVVDKVQELGASLNRVGRGMVGADLSAIQSTQYAVGRLGVGTDELAGSFAGLEAKAASAALGLGPMVPPVMSLGIAIRKSNGELKNGAELFDSVIEKLKKAPNNIITQQRAIAYLGESLGRQAVAAAKSGKFDQWKKDVDDFGAKLGGPALKASEDFAEEQGKIGLIMKNIRQSAAVPLIGSLGRIGKSFTDFVRADKGAVGKSLQASAGQFSKLEPIIAKIGTWLYKMVPWIGVIGEAFVAAGNAVGMLVGALSEIPHIGEMIVGFGIAMFAAWAPVTATLIGLLLIFDDIRGWMAGEDSLIGHVINGFTQFHDELMKPNANDPWWLVAIKKTYETIVMAKQAWQDFQSLLNPNRAGVDYVSSGKRKRDEEIISKGGEFGLGDRIPLWLQSKEYRDAKERLKTGSNISDLPSTETEYDKKFGARRAIEDLNGRRALEDRTAPLTDAATDVARGFGFGVVPTIPIGYGTPGGSERGPISVNSTPQITINVPGLTLKQVMDTAATIADESFATNLQTVLRQLGLGTGPNNT